MRIGQFTSKHGLSKDTIRHYIDMGLIIPIKNGSHYEFDETSDEDIKDIMLFKDMGFSLNEIKSIITFKRLGKLTNYQAAEYYRSFFINKLAEVDDKLNQLNQTKGNLSKKIIELSNHIDTKQFNIGINLSSLHLLSCHKCHHSLSLTNGTITHNQVMDGELTCTCGNQYRIEDGILYVKESKSIKHFDEHFLVDYAIHTPPSYLDNIYKSFIWSDSHIDPEFFKDKVVIDLGVGLGFTLRHIYERLNDSTLYIAVDHDMNQLKLLKRLIEHGNMKKNILFLCSDFLEMPLQDHCVDLVIDGTGSSNYAFTHSQFLLTLVDHHLKPHSKLLGSYIIYSNFSAKNSIPEKNRKLFKEEQVISLLKQTNYSIIDQGQSNVLTEGGKFESYIGEGEKVYCLMVYAKKFK